MGNQSGSQQGSQTDPKSGQHNAGQEQQGQPSSQKPGQQSGGTSQTKNK